MIQKSPRLLLVFLNIVFFGLETVASIIVFFVIVVIYDPRKIFLRTFRSYVIRSYITFSSRGTRASVFLFVFLFLKPLFELFWSFLKDFCERIICGLGVLGFRLKFFNSRVLHGNTLDLYLGHGDVNKTIALLSLVVYLSDVRSWLKTCFSFSLNSLLNYYFSSIQFLTLLFYLGFYGGLKAFPKESNKVKLS